MIISDDEYKEVLAYCQRLLQNMALPTTAECLKLGVSTDAALCIYQQLYTRRVKKLSGLVENDITNIAQRVSTGETLFDIAKEKRFSPYKLAKIYAKHYCPKNFKISKIVGNNLLSSAQFDDPRIGADIIRCCLEDPFSSQSADLVKHCMGKEYEELLYDLLRGKQICFETEAELRLQGKPKTPDALLLFPMGVKIDDDSDPEIIHWIDSKAMFGDAETFDEHLEQLHGYVNRYGKGLVLYWHGVTREIIGRSPSIVAIDRFPEHWLFPCDL